MKRYLLPLLAIVGLALMVVSGLVLFTDVFGEPELNGTLYNEPRDTPEFTLTSASGEPVSLSDYRGQVVLIYFGYTFCPDACPATMADLARAKEQAGVDDEVQVLMISVDPQRDTPQTVQEYVENFDPSFVGLTGEEAQLAAAAEDFGVFFQKQEGSEETGYLVDHTARVFLINQEGELMLTYAFDTPPEQIASDLETLAG
jgi:protein SCO1/2